MWRARLLVFLLGEEEERGATMAEYVLMVMLVAAVVFFGAQALGSGLLDRFQQLVPLWSG